jgi:cell division protease FtsH
MDEFEKAKDKILMGAERRSMVMSEEEKAMTAYHEAGHAIVGRLVPDHDPVYKVSIIPRGRALGVTMYLPEQDRFSHSKQHLESNISSLYGGRIAEDMIYGFEKVSTGASNDIERATQLARKMVTQWGFSQKLGPMLFAEEEGEVFLGRTSSKSLNMSDDTAKAIYIEIKAFVDRNYQRAEKILNENRDILESMKEALMHYETIDAKQIDDLMERREVRAPMAEWDNHSASKKPPKADNNASSDEKEDSTEKKEQAAPDLDKPTDASAE